MVAYSFQQRFAQPIIDGTKLQTIRAHGKRRHARPGEALQLFTGMRMKQCKLIREAKCIEVANIRLELGMDPAVRETFGSAWGDAHWVARGIKELNKFAQSDGFENWREIEAFWRAEHGAIESFNGVVIRWAA